MEMRKISVCVLLDVQAEFEIPENKSLLSPTASLNLIDAIQKKLNNGDWSFTDV